MVYNLTSMLAANSTLDLLHFADLSIMNGIFFVLAIVATLAIVMINFSFFQGKEFILFGSFFVSIIAGLFWLSGLVNFFVLLTAFIFNLGAVIAFVLLK